MANYKIIFKDKVKYEAVIYSVSYVNPIENFLEISNDLKKHVDRACYILFDLLMANGQNFNRFAEGYFNGEEIEYDSLRVVEINDNNELKEINKFYHRNVRVLNNGILTPSEKFMYAKSN